MNGARLASVGRDLTEGSPMRGLSPSLWEHSRPFSPTAARESAPWWLTVPGGFFVALLFFHEPVRRKGDRARRAVEFYSKGLARLEGRWAGSGVSGSDFLDLEHPYAADLDLFGVGSLFERLCSARTRSGEETLSSWLLAPATPETIQERHVAISELRPGLTCVRTSSSWESRSGRESTRRPWPNGVPPNASFRRGRSW